MKEVIVAVLTALAGGGVGAALVVACNERWKLKFQRRTEQEDREADKADRTDEIGEELDAIQKGEAKRNEELQGRLENIEMQIAALSEGVKLLLLERVLEYGEYLIDKKEITYDERKRFHAMHDCYHNGLDGNGDADIIVNAVNELPLKI